MFPKDISILVADDTPSMRLQVVNILKSLGYTHISQAADGEKAMMILIKQKLEEKNFDLIISDWNMPVMSGLDLLKAVKQDSLLKKIPFIMVTAEGERTQVMKAVVHGVSDYLIKPIDAAIFERKLAEQWHKLNSSGGETKIS